MKALLLFVILSIFKQEINADHKRNSTRNIPDAKVADHRTFMAKVLKNNKLAMRPTLFDTIVIVTKDGPDSDLPFKEKKTDTTSTTIASSTTSTKSPTQLKEEEEKLKYHHKLDQHAFKILNESMKIAIEQCKEYHCGIKVRRGYHFRPNDDYHVVELHKDKVTQMIRDYCGENNEEKNRKDFEQRLRNLPHQLLEAEAGWNIDGYIFKREMFLRHMKENDEKESCFATNSVEEGKFVQDVLERLSRLISVKEFRDSFKVSSFRLDPWPGVTFEKSAVAENVSWKCNKLRKAVKLTPEPVFPLLAYIAFWCFILLSV